MARDAAALDHRTLRPTSLAGGVHLAPSGGLDFSSYLEQTEAQRSLNWHHYRGHLVPRDELSEFMVPSTATGPTQFWDGVLAGGANPTSRITGLHQAEFPNRTRFVMIHDSAHVWSWDGGVQAINRTPAAPPAGSNDAPWSGAMALGEYLFCDGINQLHFWNGVAALSAVISSKGAFSGPGFTLIARHVFGFAGRAVLAHTLEGVADLGTRVRWCARGNLADWNPVNLTGAGFADLFDTGGTITGGATSPELLVITKTDAICLGVETGDDAAPIAFPTYLNIGSPSGRSIQFIDPTTLVFLGWDDIHFLSGSQTRSIGRKVREELFPFLDYGRLRHIVSWTEPHLNLYHLMIPLSGTNTGDGTPNDAPFAQRIYTYNWAEDHWNVGSVFHTSQIQAAVRTHVALSAGVTWTTVTGTWDTITGTWASLEAGASPPYILASSRVSATDNRLFRFNTPSSGLDRGTDAINYTYLSRIFRLVPDASATLDSVWVVCRSAVPDVVLTVSAEADRNPITARSSSRIVSGTGINRLLFPLTVTGTFHSISLAAAFPIEILHIEPVIYERETV